MADFAWADRLADELEKKVHRLEADYRRLDRIASRRTGETRAAFLDRLIDLKADIYALLSRIDSLRTRRKF